MELRTRIEKGSLGCDRVFRKRQNPSGFYNPQMLKIYSFIVIYIVLVFIVYSFILVDGLDPTCQIDR